MSCAGCAGDSGKNLDSNTLDHDGVIMMDSGNVRTVHRVGETMMDHGHVHNFSWHDYALF